MSDESTIIHLAYSKKDDKFTPIAGQEFDGEVAKPTDMVRVGDEWVPLAVKFTPWDTWNIVEYGDGSWSVAWRYDYTETHPTILLKINHDDRLPGVDRTYSVHVKGGFAYTDTEEGIYRATLHECAPEICVYTHTQGWYEELSDPLIFKIQVCRDMLGYAWKYYWWWFKRTYADPDRIWVIDYNISAAVSYHYLETRCIKDWGINLTLTIDGEEYSKDAKLVRGSECTEHPGYATYSGNTAYVDVVLQKKQSVYRNFFGDRNLIDPLKLSATVDSFVKCMGYGLTDNRYTAYSGADLRINVNIYAKLVNTDTGETEEYKEKSITLTPDKSECTEYYAEPGDSLPSYAFAPLDIGPEYVDASKKDSISRSISIN